MSVVPRDRLRLLPIRAMSLKSISIRSAIGRTSVSRARRLMRRCWRTARSSRLASASSSARSRLRSGLAPRRARPSPAEQAVLNALYPPKPERGAVPRGTQQHYVSPTGTVYRTPAEIGAKRRRQCTDSRQRRRTSRSARVPLRRPSISAARGFGGFRGAPTRTLTNGPISELGAEISTQDLRRILGGRLAREITGARLARSGRGGADHPRVGHPHAGSHGSYWCLGTCWLPVRWSAG